MGRATLGRGRAIHHELVLNAMLMAVRRRRPRGTLVHRNGTSAASKGLGHTEVSTTMKYLHLVASDIQASHQRLSILKRLR